MKTDAVSTFPGLWTWIASLGDLEAKYWVTFALGYIILFFYGFEKYNSPSYSRTAIGRLAQLSPRNLAPDYRYRKGRIIYLAWMSLLYLAFCLIGTKLQNLPGLSLPESLKDPGLWPITAATILVTTSVANDARFPGTIEAYIRRMAHEAAFIPTAVQTLAYQLSQLNLGLWRAAAEAGVRKAVQDLTGRRPIEEVQAEPDGKFAKWVRANVLIRTLNELDGPVYSPIKARDENKDALRFLATLRESIRARYDGPQNASLSPDAEKTLSEDIDQFLDGISTLLASILLQATPAARDLESILTGFDFRGIDAAMPPGRLQYAMLVLSVLAGISGLVWVVLYYAKTPIMHAAAIALPSLIGVQLDADEYNARISWLIVNTALLSYATFLIGTYVRDWRLNNFKWEERLGSYIVFIATTGAVAGVIGTVWMLLNPNNPLRNVALFLVFNLVLAATAAFFLAWHLRQAARAGDTPAAIAWNALGPGPLAHAFVAAAAAALLMHLIQSLNYEDARAWSFSRASSAFDDVRGLMLAESRPASAAQSRTAWFAGRYREDQIDEIRDTLQRARDENSMEGAANLISAVCTRIDAALPDNGKLFYTRDPGYAGECRVHSRHLGYVKGTAEDRFVQFGRELATFWATIDGRRHPDAADMAQKRFTYLAALAFVVVFCVTFWFAAAVRLGRIYQLRNQIDRIDDDIIDRVRSSAETYLARAKAAMNLDKWLVARDPKIKGLTPIEAIRYDKYRSRLSDSLSAEDEPILTRPALRAVG